MHRFSIRRVVQSLFAATLLLSALIGGGVASAAPNSVGAVYALTNAAGGNAVVVWSRSSDGTLTPAGSYATGGAGIAAGLGSQGAIVLSQNHQWLFAVNAGSNDISSFRVDRDGLTLADRVASGGARPTSLTVYKNLLYVLNAGGSGNISGFAIGNDGSLAPLAGSTRPLSGSATAPAQVQFSPDGALLLVAERNTQTIDAYLVGADGRASGPIVNHSSGAVPFGFAFGKRGQVFFSEAGGGQNGLSAASSYAVSPDGTLAVVTGSAPTYQGAACWLVVTNNGRYAYTANAASNSITGFAIGVDGSLTLVSPDGHTAATGSGATDMALSVNSQFLYVRNGRDGSIGAYAVQSDGSLVELPGAGGLPAGSAGLAAY
ncbi:MAG: beta-propeller fold lactonase family protein [Kouleothrix sp.]|nr:beta-propeller fold lactonase family protein [Kouleothrix sp.]